jgi:hypothetical protein
MEPYCCVTRKRTHIYVFRKHITGIQTENIILHKEKYMLPSFQDDLKPLKYLSQGTKIIPLLP